MSKETGGPAFPISTVRYEDGLGMTLRDYFAAKAMQAWVSVTTKTYIHRGEHQIEMAEIKEIAEAAYRQADAMLKAREQ